MAGKAKQYQAIAWHAPLHYVGQDNLQTHMKYEATAAKTNYLGEVVGVLFVGVFLVALI
jgi:hypothetical protein